MKKTFGLKIAGIILIFIISLACIILYFEHIQKISIVENIKNKKAQMINEEITLIDVTNLATGEEVSHNCQNYLQKKYDETNHWNECTACQKKYNIVKHSYTTTGIYGCSATLGYQYNNCTCGYSYELPKKEHTFNGQILQYNDSLAHYSVC